LKSPIKAVIIKIGTSIIAITGNITKEIEIINTY